MIPIFIASDHAGFDRKNEILTYLKSEKYHDFELNDLGPQNLDSVDFPDFADLVCNQVLKNPRSIGILICGSGQGMAIRANKFQKIRAALCWNLESAHLSRAHNDAQVLCFGARMISLEESKVIVDHFLSTQFEGGRHQQRVLKMNSSKGLL